MRRPSPQPFHPPVGTSDEVFMVSRRWIVLAVLLALVAAAAILVVLRP